MTIKNGIKRLLLMPLVIGEVLSAFYRLLMRNFAVSADEEWQERTRLKADSQVIVVSHRTTTDRTVTLTFHAPNALCRFRAETFSSKEPDTLEWIDKFGDGGVLFDIGANIGLYSVYFAKSKNRPVFAFEPSVFNLPALAKNINANSVESQVRIIPNPLSSSNGFADFRLGSSDEGGALSAFGVAYGHDGKKLQSTFSYQTCGFSLDTLLTNGFIDQKPSLIKIDVDGIEHLILEGARRTIADPSCRSILIEVDEEFEAQASTVTHLLTATGFVMRSKSRSPLSSSDGVFGHVYNQIWFKL